MKKGIYIACESDGMSPGVRKKIKNQIQAFSKYFNVTYIGIKKKRSGVMKAILSRMPLGSAEREYEDALEAIVQQGFIDFFYFRGHVLDRKFLWFLAELKKRNPLCKIVFEIPTYPNGSELLKNKTMWPWYFKNIFNRSKLKQYVDRIATYSDDNTIYEIPTLRIKNGIGKEDFPDFSSLVSNSKDRSQATHLVAVASFQKAHGYDRVIKGMEKYYKQKHARDYILHFVGDGRPLKLYRRLVERSGLEKYVVFHGRKEGDELEAIYRDMDIGLGSFADYRNGVFLSSALKIREYLAHGLPIVSGIKEDVFDGDEEFYLQFPNNASIIDFERIDIFYQGLTLEYDRCDLRNRIWHFAKENVDIQKTMAPIIDFLAL